jgi:hypothetical protein
MDESTNKLAFWGAVVVGGLLLLAPVTLYVGAMTRLYRRVAGL